MGGLIVFTSVVFVANFKIAMISFDFGILMMLSIILSLFLYLLIIALLNYNL